MPIRAIEMRAITRVGGATAAATAALRWAASDGWAVSAAVGDGDSTTCKGRLDARCPRQLPSPAREGRAALGLRFCRLSGGLLRGGCRGGRGLGRFLGRAGLAGGWGGSRQGTHQAGLATGRIVGMQDALLGRLVERADGAADFLTRQASRLRQRRTAR